MPTKRGVLASLKRDELLEALDAYGLGVADRRVRDQLIDALARSRTVRTRSSAGSSSSTRSGRSRSASWG